LSPRIINPTFNRGCSDRKNRSPHRLFIAVFFTIRTKLRENGFPVFLLSPSSLFLSFSAKPDPTRSSLRRRTKLNYVFSSASPSSATTTKLLGNFSILNKNKFRSEVFRIAGKARGTTRAIGHWLLLVPKSEGVTSHSGQRMCRAVICV